MEEQELYAGTDKEIIERKADLSAASFVGDAYRFVGYRIGGRPRAAAARGHPPAAGRGRVG
eukprot:10184872-Lingulodinium_polyedra.AAC.1